MKTPLASIHAESGAEVLRFADLDVPGSYGDVEAEVAALHSGCGLIDRSWVGRLELLGEDRVRFLNGLTTANVATLEPGRGRETLLTDGSGRVLSDAWLLALPDRLWLELPVGRTAAVREHLSRFIVADRVEITSIEDLVPLTLIGPRTAEVLAACGASVGRQGTNRRETVSGFEVHVDSRRLGNVAFETLWVSSALVGLLWEELLTRGRAIGLRPVGVEALERLRTEAGVGRWGRDFDAESLPQETGRLEAAVDFDKGCYLGQEIVARLHYRGKPKRLSVPVAIEGEGTLASGPLVDEAGAEVGLLTSVAPSLSGEGGLGIATLLRETLEAGVPLRTRDGRAVRFRDLS